MIYNFRGTSGSGKTTLVKKILNHLRNEPGTVAHDQYIQGRKQPYWHEFRRANGEVWIFLGHYNIACGGCDTISGLDTIFELVRDHAKRGHNVVFEGLIVCSDANRIIALARDFGDQLVVIQLTTPKAACLDGIRSRREERGASTEFKSSVEKNVDAKIKTCEATLRRLKEAAPNVVREHSRQEAASYMSMKLGCNPSWTS